MQIVPFAILGPAIIQWYGIGERTHHAWWMWYKFKDYGRSVPTDMSYEMVSITYGLSAVLILTSLIIKKYIAARSFSAHVNSISAGMLIFGLIWLTFLILSPFAILVKR